MVTSSKDRNGVAIVTDSTARFPKDMECPCISVPQNIIFGQESFLEDEELGFDEFVARLKGADVLPKTAPPSPGQFIEAYDRCLRWADSIISIHPSTELSGTVRSAVNARALEFSEADVRIIDSRTIGPNLGSLVQAAVEWAAAGMSSDEIEAAVCEMAGRARSYFLISTLEYLQRGGRIGRAAALAGSLLRLKPILTLEEGEVAVAEKVRTERKARQRLQELTLAECPADDDCYLCVMEADAEDAAAELAARLGEQLGLSRVPIVTVGSAITTHAGPGVVGVGFFRAKERA